MSSIPTTITQMDEHAYEETFDQLYVSDKISEAVKPPPAPTVTPVTDDRVSPLEEADALIHAAVFFFLFVIGAALFMWGGIHLSEYIVSLD